MKILHISDLHIGKRVSEHSMLEDQKHILRQILALAEEADVILLAGDIYDRSQPSAEAIETFDAFLADMHRRGCRVGMIYGNHDKPELIAYAAGILRRNDIHVSPVYSRENHEIASFAVPDEHGTVRFWLLPYVRAVMVREALADDSIRDDTAALKRIVEALPFVPGERNVLAAHQFVTGAAPAGSEEAAEQVTVGGLTGVDASVFAPFDYVALGHIHSAQRIPGTMGRVRYSGAQLCYDLSEVRAGTPGRYALMVTLGAEGVESVEKKTLLPLRPMRMITGKTVKELFEGEGSSDYVYITLADEEPVPDAAEVIRKKYPNCLNYTYAFIERQMGMETGPLEMPRTQTPMELFARLYESQTAAALTDRQRAELQRLMDEMEEEAQ